MPAANVDEQGEKHAEQGGEAMARETGRRQRELRRQAQEEAQDRRREAHPQHAEGELYSAISHPLPTHFRRR